MGVRILLVHHNPEAEADSILAVVVVHHIRTLAGVAVAEGIRMGIAVADKEVGVAVAAARIVLEEDTGTGPGDTDMVVAGIGFEAVVLRTVPEADIAATVAVGDIGPVAVEGHVGLAEAPGVEGIRVRRLVKVRVLGIVDGDIGLAVVPEVGDREPLHQRRVCQ